MQERLELAAADGTSLAGTLTRPSARRAPGALLLNGSGPLDRDSNIPGQALNVAIALAERLAAAGVASLRFDKRGVGESGGDYLTTGFEQEVEDARAALSALRGADGVDPERVAVVGHSVGGTIAIRLASGDGVAAVVLLATAARSGEEVMRQQSDRIAESMLRRTGAVAGLASGLVARVFVRRQKRTRQRLLESSGDVTRIGLSRVPARWFREFMAYDPVPDARAVTCPVLAITGKSDIQVDPDDVAVMGRLVRGDFTGLTPDGLSHVLRVDAAPPGLRAYAKQLVRPVDEGLLEQVATWTAARLGAVGVP